MRIIPPSAPLDPSTLLSPQEEETLRGGREVIADAGAAQAAEVAARAGLCDWERDLLSAHGAVPEAGAPDPAVAEAAVQEATRQTDEITSTQTRRQELVRALAEEQDTVDLDELQSLLVSAQVHVVGPVAWVEELLTVTGQQESGPLLRLLAGVKSVQARRDGNVEWATKSEPSRGLSVVTVTAQSARGCWRDRAWELTSRVEVRQDEYEEVLVRPHGPGEGHSLVVHSSSGVPGHHTTYRGVVVGEMAVRWWMAVNARQGVRDTINKINRRNREVTADLEAAAYLKEAAARDEPLRVREATLVAEWLILSGSDGGVDEEYVEQRLEEMWPHLRPRGDVLRLLVALGSIGGQLLRDLVPARDPQEEESWGYWDRDQKLREVAGRLKS